MKDRMTLTDIARHMDISRPTAYKIVRSFGFPHIGNDRRWVASEVLDWIAEHTTDGAVIVGGMLVR